MEGLLSTGPTPSSFTDGVYCAVIHRVLVQCSGARAVCSDLGEQDGLELEGGVREERYSRGDLDAVLIRMT